MRNPLIDLALVTGAGMTNRAHRPAGPGHLRVNAATDDSSAEILIYGEIGGYWDGIQAEDFVKEIGALRAETIHLRVNSPGGSVFDGVTIYNAIAQHPAYVIVHIEGVAASIASVIAMAGDEIRIGESANIMIHKPWSLALGDAEIMRKEAAVLDKLEDGLLAIYAARTSQKVDALRPLLAAETWFRGQEAVDQGFADIVVPAKTKAAARMPLLNLYQHTPVDLRSAARSAQASVVDPDEITDPRAFETMLKRLGFSRRFATAVTAGGFKAARGLRDADEDTASTELVQAIRASTAAIRALCATRG
jgi:ATP-dependent protease ClpP protease subunit